jgi:hypothetical protein
MHTHRFQSTLITCPNCNARGALTVERDTEPGGVSAGMFVRISGDFHAEVGRLSPDSVAVVCSVCDEIYDIELAVRKDR